MAILLSRNECNIESRYPGAIILDENRGRELVRIAHEGDEFWTPRFKSRRKCAESTSVGLGVDEEFDQSDFQELRIGLETSIQDENELQESDEPKGEEYLAAE